MNISRRDFLKLSALLTASSFCLPGFQLLPSNLSTDPEAKNVLIIVFDTLSAANINFLGYPRETMPKLTRLLDRAHVYHNHYASSNFTTPGTASLLTGRESWDHRALILTDTVRLELATHNIFSLFDDYYRQAYTHNYIAEILLQQFNNAISEHTDIDSLLIEEEAISLSGWFNELMGNYRDTRNLFTARLVNPNLDGYLYSLLFPSLLGKHEYQIPPEIAKNFPLGVPMADQTGPFILEDGIDWLINHTGTLPQPFLSYMHFLPPHGPYNSRREFIDVFKDDSYRPPDKPQDQFALRENIDTREEVLQARQQYDEFILYVDAEFERLFTNLEQQGVLENTLIVLTSDHGELIERGVYGHNYPYLFEPVVKVPLIIFEPQQKERKDHQALTSSIDLLPTLLRYTNHQIPSGLPGKILPGFNQHALEESRTIYTFYANYNKDNSHITTSTLSFRRENMKVIRYAGYSGIELYSQRALKLNLEAIESDPYYLIFDLENDPEELTNLAQSPHPGTQVLIEEIEHYFRENIEFPK